MLRRPIFSIMLVVTVAMVLYPVAWPAEETDAAAKTAEKKDKEDKASVAIKQELQLLEKVFGRRMLLHFLKNNDTARKEVLQTLAPDSAGAIKRLLEKDKAFKQLDYHFQEKIKNCETRILQQLRKDKFQGVEDLLEFVRDKQYPDTAAFAPLISTVELNFRYARRKQLIEDEDFAQDLGARLTEAVLRIQGTAGHSAKELAQAMWKDKPADKLPAWWFDSASGVIPFDFDPVPAVPDFPLVDFNTATQEDLLVLPSVETETAEAIVKYAQKQGFQGPEELRLIREIPEHLQEPLQTLCRTSHITQRKKWTVMVFLNAANNLEPAGVEDLNEMEKVGSSRQVNVVVEMARYYSQRKSPPASSSYFFNPLTERHPVFYYGLDNEPGISRFYVLEDQDDMRVGSVLKYKGPKADAGSPESLVDFAQWTIKHYPAEHYALVIWDHGAGWSGVSYDDNTHHGMDLPKVRTALEEICTTLEAGQHIDILDFDACLMATLEVGYELRDTVDYLVASQAVEPGDGMPYDDYLKWLVTYPSAPPVSFAKAMVDSYVKSYAPQGSQTNDGRSAFFETKSAVRLDRIAELRQAVDQVATLILERPALMGKMAEYVMHDTRRFGRLVDIHDFFAKLAEHKRKDRPLKEAVERVIELIGYPQEKYKLVNEVVIKRRSPGQVIWGFNDWLVPPRSLAPFVHEARCAKTPLVGPDGHGNYVAHLRFPAQLQNPKTKKSEVVREINYRFNDDSTQRTAKDFQNIFITTDFAGDAVVIAEGHMVANSRSHGLSLYFPAYLGFNPEYRRLQFSQDSAWARLCERFPLTTLKDANDIGLLGISHLTRAERERLGQIVTPEAFREAMRTLTPATPLSAPLQALGHAVSVVPDPRPYGQDWAGLLQAWKPALIVVDNTAGAPAAGDPYAYLSARRPTLPSHRGPATRTLDQYLSTGGALLLTYPGIASSAWDRAFYEDTLNLAYGQNWDQSYEFVLNDQNEPVFEIVPARKGRPVRVFTGGEGVTPLCLIKGTAHMIGAKIERDHPITGQAFRAVLLGFYLADVKDQSQRETLLKNILDFLDPEGRLPVTLPTDKTKKEDAPVIASNNPLVQAWNTPFGVPPFERIEVSHYQPAFEAGVARHNEEIAAIANNPEAPSFANTLEAMDRSGQLLDRVSSVFYNQNSAHTNEAMQDLAKEFAPLLSAHSDNILLNEALFKRIQSVYKQKDKLKLTEEQQTLLKKVYQDFVRGGAKLDADKKARLRQINERLSLLSVQFGENVLKENNQFEMVIDDKADLAGLPQRVIDAAAEAAQERGHAGKWVFTLHKPSLIPFLQFSEKRNLRKKMYQGYTRRGDHNDELDNKAILIEMVALRRERAQMLGYKSHAHYILDKNMAKTPDRVYALLDQLWQPALAQARAEVKAMQALIEQEGKRFRLKPWDWWYYTEKLRQAKYNLDENDLRPYFKLENVIEGVTTVAQRLWGITLTERTDLPVYHEDVQTFEVKDRQGKHLGILYTDYFPRASKRGGAWMSSYRKQRRLEGENVTPVICNVGNFTKPTADNPSLLSLDETLTLFHEFGHALHGLLSDCTYDRLSGTAVARDFVELPSQIMENWATEPEVLKLYARHYQTDKPMPGELIQKIQQSNTFNQGFITVEYLAASYLDMDWHTLTETTQQDALAFEDASMQRIKLIPEILPRYRSTYFRHIFAGGYSSGYYSYVWAQVLDADAFQAFKETDLFDQKTADAFLKHILSQGGKAEPMVLYKRFRGAEPRVDALLQRKGFE